MSKKYRVQLTPAERQELKALVSQGRAAASKQTHARILLLSDEAQADGGMKDEEIARGAPDWAARPLRECVVAAWRKGLRRRWRARSNFAGGRRDWTVRGKPT